MGVVLFIGAAAAVVLRFWRWMQASGETGQASLLNIKRQAAGVAAIAGSVFDIISALTNAKVTVSHTLLGAPIPKPLPTGGLRFGQYGHTLGPGGTPETA